MNIRKMTALLICLALLLAGCGASSKQSVMRSEMPRPGLRRKRRIQRI